MQSVTLNKKLFENIEYLNNLKIYFSDYDQISDGANVFMNYGNESETNQNEVRPNMNIFRSSSILYDDDERNFDELLYYAGIFHPSTTIFNR